MKWEQTRPTKTTQPEHEVLLMLHMVHQQHPKITTHHVKGHQKGSKLTRQAILNIRCDALASAARSHPQPPRTPLPQQRATLYINEMEASSNAALTLRQAHTSQALREYLEKKYHWNNASDLIDWTIHGRAIRKLPQAQKTFILKFIHEWLPVNSHHSSPNPSPYCHACKDNIESQTHFLCCPHPAQAPQRQQALEFIKDHVHGIQTDPYLAPVILQNAIIKPIQTIDHKQHPKRYHKLILSQNKIGWNQILKGRLSLEFVTHYDLFSEANNYSRSGELWSLQLIRSIWKYVYMLWKIRNEAHHKEAQTSNWYRNHLLNTVTNMYEQTQHLDKIDKYVLPEQKSTILSLRNRNLKQFIERTKPKLQRALKRTKTRLQQRNHNILEYIQAKAIKPKKKKKTPLAVQKKVQTITTAITQYFQSKPDPRHKHNLKPP